jgi:hypothetical protein
MKVKVAITGPLSILRKEAAQLINSNTNACFVSRVTHGTSYLVASRMDTVKARSAVALGIPIISENEMMDFIRKRIFPEEAQMTIWSCSVEVGISGLLDSSADRETPDLESVDHGSFQYRCSALQV